MQLKDRHKKGVKLSPNPNTSTTSTKLFSVIS